MVPGGVLDLVALGSFSSSPIVVNGGEVLSRGVKTISDRVPRDLSCRGASLAVSRGLGILFSIG